MAVETERRYKYAETFGFVTIYIKWKNVYRKCKYTEL